MYCNLYTKLLFQSINKHFMGYSDCRCNVMCVKWREQSMWADGHTLSIHKSKARHEASLCSESSGLPLALAGSRGVGVWRCGGRGVRVWGYSCQGVDVRVYVCEGVAATRTRSLDTGWPLHNTLSHLDSFKLRGSIHSKPASSSCLLHSDWKISIISGPGMCSVHSFFWQHFWGENISKHLNMWAESLEIELPVTGKK